MGTTPVIDGFTEDQVAAVRIAAHEAGHAVAAMSYGCNVVHATRMSDPDGKPGGHVRYVPNPYGFPDESRAVVAISGWLGAALIGFGAEHGLYGCSGDIERIRALGYSPDDKHLVDTAVARLRGRRHILEAIAAGIYQRGTVYQDDIETAWWTTPEAVAA